MLRLKCQLYASLVFAGSHVCHWQKSVVDVRYLQAVQNAAARLLLILDDASTSHLS